MKYIIVTPDQLAEINSKAATLENDNSVKYAEGIQNINNSNEIAIPYNQLILKKLEFNSVTTILDELPKYWNWKDISCPIRIRMTKSQWFDELADDTDFYNIVSTSIVNLKKNNRIERINDTFVLYFTTIPSTYQSAIEDAINRNVLIVETIDNTEWNNFINY